MADSIAHILCSTQEDYEASCVAVASSPNADVALLEQQQEQEFLATPASHPDIGKYTNVHHIRDGLFSTVFSATNPTTSSSSTASLAYTTRSVALKQTYPSREDAPHDSVREARILDRLNHERIIPLLESFSQPGGQFFLAFPLMRLTLADRLEQSRTDTISKTRRLLTAHVHDLFRALSYLHSQSIIHRDIKPANILLATPSGPAYLADFGIAWSPATAPRNGQDSTSYKITDVGTTCYRPPELLFGNTAYGCTLDLWAAGCVVAEVIRDGHAPLFDAGELGSELTLVKSIFSTIGTPDEVRWPEATGFRDWGKMEFRVYPRKPWQELLKGASTLARKLVDDLVRYESVERMSADQVSARRLAISPRIILTLRLGAQA